MIGASFPFSCTAPVRSSVTVISTESSFTVIEDTLNSLEKLPSFMLRLRRYASLKSLAESLATLPLSAS